MQNFSSYFSESQHVAPSRYETKEHALSDIQYYLKLGEISNRQYEIIKSNLNRFFEKEGRNIQNHHIGVMQSVRQRHPENPELTREISNFVSEIYYSVPSSLSGITAFEKKLNLVVKKIKPHAELKKQDVDKILTDAQAFIANWKGVWKDLGDLKNKVVKAQVARERTKQAEHEKIQKSFSDSSSLINLFLDHMGEYIARSKVLAAEFVRDKLLELSKNGWDLNKVEPKTKGGNDRVSQHRRDLFLKITKKHPLSTQASPGTDIRVPNREFIDQYIEENGKAAEASYRDFMAKMINKIGKPVVKATLTGNIWTGCTVEVETEDGETQKWHTQMIINFSKYQKAFNQFPTRKIS
jgi:hypothetical protein